MKISGYCASLWQVTEPRCAEPSDSSNPLNQASNSIWCPFKKKKFQREASVRSLSKKKKRKEIDAVHQILFDLREIMFRCPFISSLAELADLDVRGRQPYALVCGLCVCMEAEEAGKNGSERAQCSVCVVCVVCVP